MEGLPLTFLGMALKASHAALADAQLSGKDIDFVLSYTEGDSCSPGEVGQYLGIPHVPHIEIHDGEKGRKT